MRYTRFEIDGHEFDTYKEAVAFRTSNLDKYDVDFRINTLLYESEESRDLGLISKDFSECGTDWRVSPWMQERMFGLYTDLEDYSRLWQRGM